MKETESSQNKKHKKTLVLCIICAIIVIATVLFTYCLIRANADTIYPNVSIGNYKVGNMTPNQAKQLLDKNLSGNHKLKFYCGGTEFEISGDEISFNIDINESVINAYNTGRQGGAALKALNVLKCLMSPNTSDVCMTYDKDKLTLILEDYLGDRLKDMVPYSVTEGENCLIINNGSSGRAVDMKKINDFLINDAKDLNMNTVINIDIQTVNPEKIDPDKFYKEYNRNVKNATYTGKDGVYEFEKELNGIQINYDEVVDIIEKNRNNTNDYTIPAIITKAEITVESLEKKLISRVISAYTTSFASSDANRAHNVMLAASKINGVILNPGDTFSYNKIVGPRTAATGFKNAHVYEGTKIVDGMGGGICQVSSTLYNSVLMADLKIVKRTNHSMPVGYVPMGRDATVSYGTIDFVFENDKSFPVKITANAQNRNLTISIEGVSDIDYTVDLYTETASVREYTTREVPTDALAPGEARVTQNGSNGATVYTYKIYKRNGVQYDKKQVAKSVYSPIEKIVEIGKEPVQEEQTLEGTTVQEEALPEIDENIVENTENIENVENAEINGNDESQNNVNNETDNIDIPLNQQGEPENKPFLEESDNQTNETELQ